MGLDRGRDSARPGDASLPCDQPDAYLRAGAGGAQPPEYDLHDFDVHLRIARFIPEHILVASVGLVGSVRILTGRLGDGADRRLAHGTSTRALGGTSTMSLVGIPRTTHESAWPGAKCPGQIGPRIAFRIR